MAAQGKPATPVETGVPFVAVVATLTGWLIPGAGHLILRRPVRAAIFFVLVLLTIFVGVWLEGKLFVRVSDQPLSTLGTLGSMAMGIPYFVLRYAMEYEGNLVSSRYEYGSAFLLTAGLLNFMVILDVWDISRGVKE